MADRRSLRAIQSTVFDPAVHLETAKALDITIPQAILLRADEVIP